MIGTPQMIADFKQATRYKPRVDCASIAPQLRLNATLNTSQLRRN
jgi:hypothetical protein